MSKSNGLTHKQQRFVEEYLVDFNATQAAIRAGYRVKTAYAMGWENLRKDYIYQAIAARAEKLSEAAEDGTRELMERFKQASGVGRIPTNRKQGIIYFLQADNGLVKLGITVNLMRRMATLNTQLPYALQPLLLIDCDNCPEVEKDLHRHFADKRVRGEWFRLTQEDIDWARLTYGTFK